MARKRRLTPEKENIIRSLIETYDVKTAADIQEALKDLMGGTLEAMLEAELTEDLGYEKNEKTAAEKENYRNGYKPKKIRSSAGELEIRVPQDRNSEFEPVIVPKYKKDISEIEQKIIN